jgi:hypothetical protein
MLTIEQVFENSHYGFLQDMCAILIGLHQSGVTIPEIVEYGDAFFKALRNEQYASMMETERMMREYRYKVRRCSLCGNAMNLEHVNDSPCTQVGGNLKSQWVCSNIYNCGETIYSLRPVHEEAAQFGLQAYFPDPSVDQKRVPPHVRSARNRKQPAPSTTGQANTNTPSKPCGGCR